MTEKEIIRQVKRNKRQAQTLLYQNYKNTWYSICLRYQRDGANAADVLQNALVKIFTKIEQFDENKGSFKSWSSQIIVNENLMFLRKHKEQYRLQELKEGSQILSRDETPIDKLSAEELSKLISALPEGYRTVFNLYVMEGYNHIEIAERLGISPGTSKSQLFKARKLLQQQVEEMILMEAS